MAQHHFYKLIFKTYICDSVQARLIGNSNALFKMAKCLYNLKELILFSMVLCVKINFLTSQQKRMLLVLKRTVSILLYASVTSTYLVDKILFAIHKSLVPMSLHYHIAGSCRQNKHLVYNEHALRQRLKTRNFGSIAAVHVWF